MKFQARYPVIAVLFLAFCWLIGGCTVYTAPPQQEVVAAPAGPVVDDPGVVAIDVEPPPPDRVYVYDQGFPPGTYMYNGFYYYGDYRYPHDVFVNHYVHDNVAAHRFVNADDNRRMGAPIEAQHRAAYARNNGRHQPAGRPEDHR